MAFAYTSEKMFCTEWQGLWVGGWLGWVGSKPQVGELSWASVSPNQFEKRECPVDRQGKSCC